MMPLFFVRAVFECLNAIGACRLSSRAQATFDVMGLAEAYEKMVETPVATRRVSERRVKA
jgi:hypothetical protein